MRRANLIIVLGLLLAPSASLGASVVFVTTNNSPVNPGSAAILGSSSAETIHLFIEFGGTPTVTGVVCDSGDGQDDLPLGHELRPFGLPVFAWPVRKVMTMR